MRRKAAVDRALRLKEWSIGIVIPARNEAASIEGCVLSVIAALDQCEVLDSRIVVVADDCTDDTARLARRALAKRGEVVSCRVHTPGSARRIGVDVALERLSHACPDRLWLANTDADTVVPTDWLSRQLDLAERGASAVAGIVAVDSFADHGALGEATFKKHYRVNSDGTHSHVHGANMGMRADAYLDAGGWKDLAVGEDHCLWSRIRQRGWPVLACAASVVTTSGRLIGRAHGGFADTLRARLDPLSGAAVEGAAR